MSKTKKVSSWDRSERECECCTGRFYPKQEDQRYCSPACVPVRNWDDSMRRCALCGGMFRPGQINQKYCSKKCGVHNTPIRARVDWDKSLRKCNFCGTEFQPVQSNQKYCNKECTYKASIAGVAASRFPILNRDGFTCFYCGRSSYKHGVELHIDHVVPVSRGGLDIASNLVTSCAECNLGKWSDEIFDLVPLLEEINERNIRCGISPTQLIKKVLEQVPVLEDNFLE